MNTEKTNKNESVEETQALDENKDQLINNQEPWSEEKQDYVDTMFHNTMRMRRYIPENIK